MKKVKEEMPTQSPEIQDYELDDIEKSLSKLETIKGDKAAMKKLKERMKAKMKSMKSLGIELDDDEDEEDEVESIEDIRSKSNKKAMKDYD